MNIEHIKLNLSLTKPCPYIQNVLFSDNFTLKKLAQISDSEYITCLHLQLKNTFFNNIYLCCWLQKDSKNEKNIAVETTIFLECVQRYFEDTIQRKSNNIDVTLYMEDMLKIIRANKRSNKSSQESYEDLLNFMRKTNPPKELKLAILIYAEKSTVSDVPNFCNIEDASKVPLDQGKLIDVKVKKAICGIIDTWSNDLKNTVNKATHASLSHILQDSDDSI